MTVEVRPLPHAPESTPAEKSVADVLRHAALIIEERGWWQGEYENAWGAVCLVGAIHRVLGPNGRSGYLPAKRAVRRIIGNNVLTWNDAEGRTAAEVTAALRAAADEAER